MKISLSPRQLFERSISEEDVFSACRALLELNGAAVHRVVERIPYRTSRWSKKSEAGIPDSFGWFYRPPAVHPGLVCPIHFFIEMKRPHGAKYRPAQIAWIEQAKRDKVIAFFANSVEQMVAGFKEYGIEIRGLK